MKRTKILSSAFIMTMVSFGAFGADEIITGGPNTCTVDVLGVFEDDATAKTIATWTPVIYECAPGQYLLETETSVECASCPTGSYCPGGTYTVESENKGTNACPTGYASSDAGASSDTQCYTACTVDMVAKATKVTGNDYYGTGTDTCEPTECIAGWHVKPGLTLTETIGEEVGTNSAYIKNDGLFSEMNYDGKGSKGQEYYGISDKNSFAVDYASKGILTGHGRCSTQAGVGIWNGVSSPEDITVVNALTDETGQSGAQYCYCQVDGFTPTGGDKVMVISAPWVFHSGKESAGDCSSGCAGGCAYLLRINDVSVRAFRTAAFGSLPALPATCAANTINIDWNPDNGGDHTINQCTYEGSIELPTPDPVKPGYTFTGWKLVDGTTTE